MGDILVGKILSFAAAALLMIAAVAAAVPRQPDGRLGIPPHAARPH
ncbi:MAG: hypothetical protein IRY89_13430 [Pseudolabrys sp.]|nr:hypothetical protein [Pseudolabrys sp.]